MVLTALALFYRSNIKVMRRIYFVAISEAIVAGAYLGILLYFVFQQSDFTRLYLTAETGYYQTIIERFLTNGLAFIGMSIIVFFLVLWLGKVKPYFNPDDRFLMALATLCALSGFYQAAVTVRLAFTPFLIQEIFLTLCLIVASLALSFLISAIKRVRGRFDIVPIYAVLSILVAFPSAKLANLLTRIN